VEKSLCSGERSLERKGGDDEPHRQGLASRMMTWLEAEARRQGYAQLGLRIRTALKGNEALYESLGFSVTDIVLHPLGGP
jgi:GNAT superfamily N-acetyltransferase